MTDRVDVDETIVAVDAGKTKFLAGVFTSTLTQIERYRITTTTAKRTIEELKNHLADIFDRHAVGSIGLAVFGPLETNTNHREFGAIVGSSEPQWSGVNLPATLAGEFATPVFFDVDVNAGALAERNHRKRTDPSAFTYLSIGTGIGGAHFDGPSDELSDDAHGARRTDPPQLGHMYLPREPDDTYPGSCRFHHSCLQGLASGRALQGRWKTPAHELPATHAAWDLEARYIARACANLLYVSSARTILIGSGISGAPGLIDRSNRYLDNFLNGFPENIWRQRGTKELIARAATAPDSSLIGAAQLAKNRLDLEFNSVF